jgi:hypothetical protein
LYSIDKDETVLRRNELEVDGVDNWPNLPRSLASREEVILDLVTNRRERIAVAKSKIGKEDSHENGAPEDLINSNLEGNIFGASSLDLAIEPVVEVVSRWSVVEETKGRKRDESLNIEWTSSNEDLQILRIKHCESVIS